MKVMKEDFEKILYKLFFEYIPIIFLFLYLFENIIYIYIYNSVYIILKYVLIIKIQQTMTYLTYLF